MKSFSSFLFSYTEVQGTFLLLDGSKSKLGFTYMGETINLLQ